MARWRKVEDYLAEHHNESTEFTVHDYAEAEGITAKQAGIDIQRYLKEQRRPRSRAQFVLYRKPNTRTANAVWLVGDRAKDARQIGDAFYSDIKAKVLRALQPDLARVAAINPRAARLVERQVENIVDGVVPILRNAVIGAMLDE